MELPTKEESIKILKKVLERLQDSIDSSELFLSKPMEEWEIEFLEDIKIEREDMIKKINEDKIEIERIKRKIYEIQSII